MGSFANVFWYENPNVLLANAELFPTKATPLSRQLNAVTRSILAASLLFFWYKPSVYVTVLCLSTMASIVLFYQHTAGTMGMRSYLEPFDAQSNDPVLGATRVNAGEGGSEGARGGEREGEGGKGGKGEGEDAVNMADFRAPDSTNPFGNLSLTDIVDHPTRPPAPPAFIPEVSDEITRKAVEMVRDLHPDHATLVSRLYGNQDDQLGFEQSLRQFYTNPCTTVAGDISTFMDFCYGNTAAYKDGECELGTKRRPVYE